MHARSAAWTMAYVSVNHATCLALGLAIGMLPFKIARAPAHVDYDAVLGGEEFGVGHSFGLVWNVRQPSVHDIPGGWL